MERVYCPDEPREGALTIVGDDDNKVAVFLTCVCAFSDNDRAIRLKEKDFDIQSVSQRLQKRIVEANDFLEKANEAPAGVFDLEENRKIETFPASRFRRGTWITYDLVSV